MDRSHATVPAGLAPSTGKDYLRRCGNSEDRKDFSEERLRSSEEDL